MTTQIVLMSPTHQKLKIVSEYIDPAGSLTLTTAQVLTDGENCRLFVHDGIRVTVTEVHIEPAIIDPDVTKAIN